MSSAPHRSSWLSALLGALGLGVALNAVLGPLVTGTIRYRFSDTLVNQGIGLDAVALLAVAPIALAAAILVRREHPAGPVLAFIPTTFAVYMTPQYVLGPEYLELSGNNEQFFVFHLALFVLAVAALVLTWDAVRRTDLEPSSRAADRRRSWVMFGVAAFIGVARWLPALAEITAGDPTLPDFVENPTSYLLIGLLDLGLVVPAAIASGIALRRGAEWARAAGYAVIGWFALVPAAVAAMAIVMAVRDDPGGSTGMAAFFSIAAAVFVAGAAALYRPMFAQPAPSDLPAEGSKEPLGVG